MIGQVKYQLLNVISTLLYLALFCHKGYSFQRQTFICKDYRILTKFHQNIWSCFGLERFLQILRFHLRGDQTSRYKCIRLLDLNLLTGYVQLMTENNAFCKFCSHWSLFEALDHKSSKGQTMRTIGPMFM
jgi:hypothetical protein